MGSPFDFAARANPFAPAPTQLDEALGQERFLRQMQEEELRKRQLLQEAEARRGQEAADLQAAQGRIARLQGGQTPAPGVPTQMAPSRPAPPRQIPMAPSRPAPPRQIPDVELDRLYEDYKQKVEHPDLGFAWGGGTPQAYRPGDDIRSGAFGESPTEGAGIRAGTTDIRTGGVAPQTRAGTFSQTDIEDIPIGQRPHSWFQDQQMETDLQRQYADRARSKALAEDPFGLSRYNYQFQAKDRQSAALDARKREVMEDLQASIQAAISDPTLPPERKEAEIQRMRNEAFAEIEAIDPRSDFKAYMGF